PNRKSEGLDQVWETKKNRRVIRGQKTSKLLRAAPDPPEGPLQRSSHRGPQRALSRTRVEPHRTEDSGEEDASSRGVLATGGAAASTLLGPRPSWPPRRRAEPAWWCGVWWRTWRSRTAPGRVVEACQQVFADGMEHVLLVNNAASLGDVSRYARTFTTRAEVDSYMSLNISSCLCLTACVLQAFPQRPGVQRTVVNVSSLCAQQPFSSWVLYCTAKAARDMMFRVLAAEEPELRVLSYAPGPLDTDMFSAARATTADPGLRRTFSDMSAQGRVLSPGAVLLQADGAAAGGHLPVRSPRGLLRHLEGPWGARAQAGTSCSGSAGPEPLPQKTPVCVCVCVCVCV
ncbi:unnamed protein product, partial [Tetraodon nigroviridis]